RARGGEPRRRARRAERGWRRLALPAGLSGGDPHHPRLHAPRRPGRDGPGGRLARRQGQPRIDAYGTVDELNAAVGVARAVNAAEHRRSRAGRKVDAILRKLQSELFDLGGELATPAAEFRPGMFRVGAAEVTALETLMDRCQKDLAPLKSFVLPGGGRVSAFLHVARTVCRRAERDVLRLMRHEDVGA